jgi:hypothetical protein
MGLCLTMRSLPPCGMEKGCEKSRNAFLFIPLKLESQQSSRKPSGPGQSCLIALLK